MESTIILKDDYLDKEIGDFFADITYIEGMSVLLSHDKPDLFAFHYKNKFFGLLCESDKNNKPNYFQANFDFPYKLLSKVQTICYDYNITYTHSMYKTLFTDDISCIQEYLRIKKKNPKKRLIKTW